MSCQYENEERDGKVEYEKVINENEELKGKN